MRRRMEVLAQRSADAADDEGPQQGDVGTATLRQLLERWMPPSAAAESDTQAGSARRWIWVLLAALRKRDAATAAEAEGLVLLCELAASSQLSDVAAEAGADGSEELMAQLRSLLAKSEQTAAVSVKTEAKRLPGECPYCVAGSGKLIGHSGQHKQNLDFPAQNGDSPLSPIEKLDEESENDRRNARLVGKRVRIPDGRIGVVSSVLTKWGLSVAIDGQPDEVKMRRKQLRLVDEDGQDADEDGPAAAGAPALDEAKAEGDAEGKEASGAGAAKSDAGSSEGDGSAKPLDPSPGTQDADESSNGSSPAAAVEAEQPEPVLPGVERHICAAWLELLEHLGPVIESEKRKYLAQAAELLGTMQTVLSRMVQEYSELAEDIAVMQSAAAVEAGESSAARQRVASALTLHCTTTHQALGEEMKAVKGAVEQLSADRWWSATPGTQDLAALTAPWRTPKSTDE